jgi:ADP-ribose pyrophosphatase
MTMRGRTISKKVIYKGRRIDLIRSEILINNRKSVREIIVHPGSSVMIPVLDIPGKKIILLKQYRYGAGKWMIELPAGTRDKNEPALKCASREIIEETGFKAGSMKRLTGFMPSPGMMTEKMDLFLASRLEKDRVSPDFDEQISIFTTTLDKAVKMILSGKIEDAKTIAGLLILKEIYSDKKLFKKYLA